MSRIVVGVSGSAACFKAVNICSALAQAGHEVTAVLTEAATALVTPLQFSCVTGNPALDNEWNPLDPAGMDHIAFARAADLMVVVPATADRIGLFAQGLAPDLLGSLSLAFDADKPRLFVPAMNPEMWNHPAVKRNVATLCDDGWQCIGPTDGATACGEVGLGRMVEPDVVLAAIETALA
jgi:phosphopantothenoylcysteine decarboxylase/phosphopantothenate--cysteine ligase